jgi:alginate O-acetyltransferase complex protein AlgI
MLFPTLSFAAFFAVVLPVSWLLMPNRVRWRLFMLAASWFFYGAADWRFVPLLAGSTVVNNYFARRIHRATGSVRKTWTVAAVATNLLVLAWFKYIGFLSLSAQSSLRYLGIHVHVPLPEVLLPIGISFFTFQALSYVIDTSRGKIRPVSLLEFAVYLSFFPHLIAGPIVRATEFLPQIKERIGPRHVDVGKAFWLISIGLFKKVVIASYLATYAADPLFGFPRQHAGVEALFGVYAYAIQIYADFSGYTDIAIGLALLLGIQFPQNFNAPYAAASLQDFWRRWHMTLSRWLRDYLYIPLGGSRRGRVRTYVNIMITMLLGGLWHGAAWTFVAWGALHGAGLIVERLRGERRPANAVDTAPDHGPPSGNGATPKISGPPPPPSTPALLVTAPAVRRRVLTLPRGDVIVVGVAAGDIGGAHEEAADEALTPNGRAGGDEHDPATDAPWPGRRAGAPRRPRPLRVERGDSPGGETGDHPESTVTASRAEEADPDLPLPDADQSAPPPDGMVSGATTWDSLVIRRQISDRQPLLSDRPDAISDSPQGTPPPPPRATRPPTGSPPPPVTRPPTGSPPPPVTRPPTGSPPPIVSTSPPVSVSATAAEGTADSSRVRPPLSPTARLWLGRLITFHVVCLAWIFFRATSFHNAVEVLGRIASPSGRHQPFNWKVAAVIVAALAVQLGPRGGGAKLQAMFSRSSFWVQALVVAGVLTVIDLLGPAGVAPFIYFRF